MKPLFFAICISIIIAISFLMFTSKKEYENNLKKYTFNFIRGVAIVFLGSCILYTFTLGILHLIFFILTCVGVLIIEFGISMIINHEEGDAVLFGLFFFIFPGMGLLTLNIETTYKELPEKEIILNDYFPEETKTEEKIVIIELSENNNATKSFVIQTYNSDIELPLYFDDISNYEFIYDDNNKIVISSKETTGIDLLAYFELKKPEVTKTETYTLYINTDDVLYN